MGLDPAGTAPAIMADRIEAPEADADAAHSTSENTLVESVPESQTSLVDLAAPSITVSTEQVQSQSMATLPHVLHNSLKYFQPHNCH